MASDHDRPLVGVGGWLAFFVFAIGIVAPLSNIINLIILSNDAETAAAYGEFWSLLLYAEWLLAGATVALLWFMVWRLINHQVWQTVRIVIAGLWFCSLGALFIEYAMVAMISGVSMADLVAEGSVDLIRGGMSAGLWSSYFLMSKRVANTYRQTSHADEAAEVFS